MRDKNLRAGETTPVRYANNAAVGSYGVPSLTKQRQEAFGERASRRKSVAWQQQQQQKQRMYAKSGGGTLGRWDSDGDGGSSNTDGYAREMGQGGTFTGGAGLETEGGGEGDRKKVLLILRRLEIHGRVSEQYCCGYLKYDSVSTDRVWTATVVRYTAGTLTLQWNK